MNKFNSFNPKSQYEWFKNEEFIEVAGESELETKSFSIIHQLIKCPKGHVEKCKWNYKKIVNGKGWLNQQEERH